MQLVHPTYNRITINPDVCFGKPCIRGMRMPIATILDYLASGVSLEELLKDYPYLEREDILQALAFASEAMHERYIPYSKAS
ncbi:MAG: DUF433 domain-containing protein [Chitinophagales bacterium]|nr:DUF433 domain-containing protein [Chitinophagales bacterium]